MPDAPSFAAMVQRIRSGDAQAAVELVKQYEKVVLLEVRLRLRDPRVRRVVDSSDVCQSVFAGFFVRVSAGQFDLDEPDQLVRLLVTMVRNKVAQHVRGQRAQRRDNRREQEFDPETFKPLAPGPTPSEAVAHEELVREVRQRLSAEERQLAELRSQGVAWAEVAAQLGGTPQARRKQLARAVSRAAQELGLDPINEE